MKRLMTRYQRLSGATIAYTECGEGPPLVLLHGNSESKRLFKRYQLEHFRDFHTFALDSRGHGETVGDADDLSIELISRDVIEFCRAKGLSKARVIGYSDGGNVALFLAANAPDLFDRIVAISPNRLASGTVDAWLRLFRAMHALFGIIGAKRQRRRFDLMLTDIGLSKERLNSIRTKVELIYAGKDMIKEGHILDIHRDIPGSSICKIETASHLSIVENAQAIEEMRGFLG
jgi:pimeloyl-ACP methyl ester carboxylesterase